jgi:hypothetical protein
MRPTKNKTNKSNKNASSNKSATKGRKTKTHTTLQ